MKANFKQFEINTVYHGDKCWSYDSRNYNNYVVTVKNKENGKKTRFEFWCSIMRPEFESEYDVLNAFYCFVSDALDSLYSFDEFCGEFGYDTDSRKAEKVYRACKRAYAKFERVSGFSDDEMYDFINELSEIAA